MDQPLRNLSAVMLVGGIGTRMRPLTYLTPKPMLPIGGKPLVERTILWLKGYGIRSVILCVAYLKEQIINYIGDGSRLGVDVRYAEFDMPLGTGGQLKTAEKYVSETFIAMNGDIVTTLNLENLAKFHLDHKGIGTISLKKFDVKVPYGHITVTPESTITKFEEKPVISFLVNAGIYVFEPRVFDHIVSDTVVSLETEVFPQLIDKGEQLNSFYEEAYWADIGTMSDFDRVDKELLEQYFSTLQARSR